MKNAYIILLIICLHSTIWSQNKLLKNELKKAQIQFDQQDYFNSYQSANSILSVDPKNEKAVLIKAASSFKIEFPIDSVLYLVQSLSASSLPDSKYFLARIYHQQKKFDESIGLLQKYLLIPTKKRSHNNDEVNYRIKQSQSAKSFFASPRRSIINNIGAEINSISAEYVPVITPDESQLFFTSRRDGSSGNKRDIYERIHEDIYVSKKINGKWQLAENAGSSLNTENSDACVAISLDGQKMMLYRSSADLLSGDLYITRIGKDGGWEKPEKMGNEINSQFIETSACFSSDTGAIYFSSNRPGGYGGKDIYRIKRLPNGNWAKPYNLGPTVNTLYDEDAPFLHPDGVTLYFSSKGHNSMGGYDVFKSVLDVNGNNYLPAENLGYPINNLNDDLYFVTSVDGLRGYYSSTKPDTYGNSDIYEIDTRFGDNDLKVKHGTAFKGEIPAKLKITLLDNEVNQVNGTYFSNPTTGRFILIMNPLKYYRAVVEAEGYTTLITEIEPLAIEKDEKELIFKLQKAK
jgi:hypothetical protein